MKKQELAATFLAEIELYVKGGVETSHTYCDPWGNEDIYLKLKEKEDVVSVANLVHKYEGRVVTVTPYMQDDGCEIAYHFDVGGMLIIVTAFTDDKTIPSITRFLKSADWTEREMKDLFGIAAVGHPNPRRLILDESIAEGVFAEYMTLSDAMAGAATNTLWERLNEAKQEKA